MQFDQSTAVIPQWTLADRLRKARLHAGLEQGELAAQMGIARSSITNYENGHTKPRQPTLMAWALCTGVELAWLSDGVINRKGSSARAGLGLAA